VITGHRDVPPLVEPAACQPQQILVQSRRPLEGGDVARFRLIPREEKFYADFVAIADELVIGAQKLEEMVATDPPVWDKAEELKEIEHKCDFLTHAVYQRLHRTFVTPIDREDIHALARSLDDVMDSIDATAGYIRTYRIQKVRPGVRDLARIITASTRALRQALEHVETRKGVSEHVVEVNRLENEADRLHQHSILQLFEDEKDPITLIKWKEILDILEDTTDRCEDVADLLEGVVLKNG
jgi:predicted phosphate transport protein (TIGR00153 family)